MVAILLSTYNGGKYLIEQIDSILNQTFSDWFLVVRDDGSSDDTIDILGKYCKKHPDKIYIIEDVKKNLGAGTSFMYLLEKIEAEYYMFSDQDDVWMPEKIERTLKKAQELEDLYGRNAPIGVFTDLEVVDTKLNVLMPSLWKGDNRHPEYIKDFYKQWVNRHAAYGCTMLINDAAKKLVLPFRQLEGAVGAHDTWIEYMLIKRGHLDYLDETTIRYRQHITNAVGANLGLSDKDELKNITFHPIQFFRKIKKDYRRSRSFPFNISYIKILLYRIKQGFQTIFFNGPH